MKDDDFTVDQLVSWLDEAKELEQDFRDKMLFWKRVRMRLSKRLDLKIDQDLAIREIERMLNVKEN